MIQLSYEDIRNQEFISGIVRLRKFTGFSPKVAYNFARVVDKIQQAEKHGQKIFNEMIEKYAVKKADGKLEEPQGKGTFRISDENLDDWQKELEEFHAIKLDPIERYKLKLSSLEKVGLTPGELLALEALIEEDAEVAPKLAKAQKPIAAVSDFQDVAKN